ncbi:MAG: hypothetical protein A2049_10830 [Elusimicrobia bacterium GWA2_62_23]|nr:MAG: hypothetical protein A2049_10830 [Elusimicrobia bacterium GWA2_62_23]OGR73826.1 MAG: hypothetical protein A2179_01475 [Elusimicrobia bacterium GWC2_63_65]
MTRPALAFALLALFAAGAAALRVPAGAREARVLLPDGFAVKAELALTPEEQARGLMFREALPEGRGMLFVFGDPGVKSFWMKNTLVDLDMVFLDDKMKVLRVFHRVPRSRPDQPEAEVARAVAPASAVLELPAGCARAHKANPGSVLRVSFPFSPKQKKNGGAAPAVAPR